MSVLFKQSLKREEERFKMEAIFHGAQIDDLSKEKKSGKENTFTFKDPKEYDYLSFEQKKELTKKMKMKHKSWATGTLSQIGKNNG